jgi:hypothetical protein
VTLKMVRRDTKMMPKQRPPLVTFSRLAVLELGRRPDPTTAPQEHWFHPQSTQMKRDRLRL